MSNKNIYSVGEINRYLKNMFASDFLLGHVCIKGEVSNCKYHSSGHIYFTLKDETGAIKAVMFRGSRPAGLTFQMKDGDQVLVSGSIEVFERDGAYQLYAKQIRMDGAGELYLKFEALKKQFEEMGMFDDSYKQPIPKYAQTIGVVTAKTGAAIQDIRSVSYRRNPGVQLILYPAQVQGTGAAESIVRGIKALDAYGVDVIIIGRGGGSIEDLWAFNEEIVARAIFDCKTPIVSAVGHKTDDTISNHVADLEAPTPSAAAELCVFDRNAALEELSYKKSQLDRLMRQKLFFWKERLEACRKQILLLSPQRRLTEKRKRLEQMKELLKRAMEDKFESRKHRLALLTSRLEGNSPLKKLESGFSLVETKDNGGLKSVKDVKVEEELTLYVMDGKIKAQVKEVIENGRREDT